LGGAALDGLPHSAVRYGVMASNTFRRKSNKKTPTTLRSCKNIRKRVSGRRTAARRTLRRWCPQFTASNSTSNIGSGTDATPARRSALKRSPFSSTIPDSSTGRRFWASGLNSHDHQSMPVISRTSVVECNAAGRCVRTLFTGRLKWSFSTVHLLWTLFGTVEATLRVVLPVSR